MYTNTRHSRNENSTLTPNTLSNFTDMLLYVSMDTKEIKKKTSNNKNLAKYE